MIRRQWGWRGPLVALCALAGLCFSVSRFLSWRAVDTVRRSIYSADPHELITTLSELAQGRPENAELSYLLAIAHRRAGKTNRALELLESAQRLGWPRKEILRQQYLIRLQSGHFEEAQNYLLALTAGGYPDDEAAEIYECVARSYLANMQIAETNAVLDYWLTCQPDAIQAHLIKADLLGSVHDPAGEMREYEEVLRIDPDHFQAHLRWGHGLLNANDFSGARRQFEQCARLRPESPAATIGLAICYGRSGDSAKGRALLQRALDEGLSESDQTLVLFELGQLALADKQPQKAIEYFERAREFSPNSARLNYGYGMALTRTGKSELGNYYLQRSKELDAQGVRFSELLDEIMQDPGNADLRCQLGKIALGLDQRKEAYRWLSSALDCDPRHEPTHQALAEYYVKAGRKDLAQQHLAQVTAGKD